ncbi:helix-turn-helix transcriptional regulator [Sutcliffiella cohnii]|uniref:HTH cro/C1-type domain-containing protein n=1 Tax=Sutcliffiella cohnii TaxID=33932 RepID=A0A223KNU6_9BACI|nr:helix-turn-helix transcriptional regulator [Sutcliffiella cohnii]AST91151.1 hypothetical protein BC6307_07590 [Sutcliffiella cohnii]MED4018738.1 helix-turn-helix transcriptional regulator [Sutcliffiella cohnii]
MINTVGYNLKMLRYERNYTQKLVAKEMGVSVQKMSAIERNKQEIDEELLKKLAEFYGVREEDILGE